MSGSRFIEALAAGAILVTLPVSVRTLDGGAGSGPLPESGQIGLLFAAFGFALAFGQPLAGRLAETRIGRSNLALGGLALFAVLTSLLEHAQSFGDLLLLRTLQGLAMALVVPTSVSLAADLQAPSRRGSGLGFFNTVKMLGFALGPPLGGLLLVHTSAAGAYRASAWLVFAACLPFLFLPDRRSPRPRPARAPGTEELRLSHQAPLACGAFVASGCATSLAALQNEFVDRLGQSIVGFGLAYSAMLVIRMLLNWPVGRLCDRMAQRPLLVLGLLLLALGMPLLPLATTTVELVLVRAALGVGMALFSIPCFTLVTSRRSRRKTVAVSMVTTGFSLGIGAGPLLTGLCAGWAGFHTPFLLWSLLALTAAASTTLTVPEERHCEEPVAPSPVPSAVSRAAV